MLTLVLTRHGVTDRSHPEQHLGQTIDVPLNDVGRGQAEALRRRLARVRFERVLASPLVRARETAEILGRGTRVELDARLLEMDYGRWEGLTYAELDRQYAAERAAWVRAPDVLACPDGESGFDVAERVGAFLVDLLRDHVQRHGSSTGESNPVLVVGHSSTNRILVCLALGLPIREYRQRLVQGQANLTVLRFEHGDGPTDARLLLLNDLAHLRSPDSRPWD